MLTEIKVLYSGDLYRFYVDETGEIVHVFLYSMLGTNGKELDLDEIPDDVLTQLETKLMR
jgi:hypothetical protein